MLIAGTAMRLPVPGPRFDWRMSGRPGSSSFCSAPELFGNPISGNWLDTTRPPRSNTRNTSAGGIVSHDGNAVSDGRIPFEARNTSGFTGFTIDAAAPSRVYASPMM
jgi:hypothetical protein